MHRSVVVSLIESKYKRYVAELVEEIKGFGDTWEDWKGQMQGSHSVFFAECEEAILSLCRNLAKRLPRDEQGLLWLVSNAYFNSDEDEPPFGELLETALEDELYSRVCKIASNEELEE
jgi:hypothetical protein